MIRLFAIALLVGLVTTTVASAQGQSSYPVIDKVADKVVAHYQSTSCQQLAAEKQQPSSAQKSTEVGKAVQYLHQNPQAAQYFISKVATPIANKMFECGMIP